MKKVLGILALFFFGCGEGAITPPDPNDPNNSNNPTTAMEHPNRPGGLPPNIPPCVVVPPTPFSSDPLLPQVWVPSYYFTPPSRYNIDFTDEGVAFQFTGNNRSGITFSPERDVSSCTDLKFRLKGIIYNQTLARSGRDNREAPIGVMIKYTDKNGVLHNTLTAFNADEPDDRETTRMFWWGFSYLNEAQFEQNFTPSISNVVKDEEFDLTIAIPENIEIKTIHSISIEGSGWTLSSKVKYFEMASENLLQSETPPVHTQGQTGNIKACFKDATTGLALENGLDTIQAFIGTYGLPVLDSNACTPLFPVPAGTYQLSFLGNSLFTPMEFEVEIVAGEDKEVSVFLSPKLDTNMLRFVLTWDVEGPTSERDLDSHLLGPNLHVFFSNTQTQEDNVWLDVDDTTWEGPETTTIKNITMLENGTYTFCVHNWSGQNGGTPGITSSNPKIEIHGSSGLLQTITPPQDSNTLWWKAISFSVTNGTLIWMPQNMFVSSCE